MQESSVADAHVSSDAKSVPKQKPQAGKTYNGVVTRVKSYGIWVDIGCDREGMIHMLDLQSGVALKSFVPGQNVVVTCSKVSGTGNVCLGGIWQENTQTTNSSAGKAQKDNKRNRSNQPKNAASRKNTPSSKKKSAGRPRKTQKKSNNTSKPQQTKSKKQRAPAKRGRPKSQQRQAGKKQGSAKLSQAESERKGLLARLRKAIEKAL